jgi:hypothetical protein
MGSISQEKQGRVLLVSQILVVRLYIVRVKCQQMVS